MDHGSLPTYLGFWTARYAVNSQKLHPGITTQWTGPAWTYYLASLDTVTGYNNEHFVLCTIHSINWSKSILFGGYRRSFSLRAVSVASRKIHPEVKQDNQNSISSSAIKVSRYVLTPVSLKETLRLCISYIIASTHIVRPIRIVRVRVWYVFQHLTSPGQAANSKQLAASSFEIRRRMAWSIHITNKMHL